jgi:hypothetical protein
LIEENEVGPGIAAPGPTSFYRKGSRMVMHRFLYRTVEGQTELKADGETLKGVTALQVKAGARDDIPRVTLSFAIYLPEIDLDEAEVVVNGDVYDSLVRLGWTPPGLAQ